MKTLLTMIAALFANPAAAQHPLPDLLARLTVELGQKRPDYLALLRPALTADQVTALEVEYGVSLPDDVKALYMWRDGQDPQSSDSFAENMMFRPLAEVLADKAELDGMIGYDFQLEHWWHPGWLPIFHNGGGDSMVVDTFGVHTGETGQLLTFYHDWEHRPILAPGLSAYLQAVLSYYQKTPTDQIKEPYSLEGHLPETGSSFTAAGAAKPVQ